MGIKAHLLEDKQISSVRVFDETKNVTFLGVGLSPNSYVVGMDFTQSRFFYHFRYFWRENRKRSVFGRFWSEKVRKRAKTQKTLKITEADVVPLCLLTPSEIKSSQRWKIKPGRAREFAVQMADTVRQGHLETLIAELTPSTLGLTPSAHKNYIYRTFLSCFIRILEWRTWDQNPSTCFTDLGGYPTPSILHVQLKISIPSYDMSMYCVITMFACLSFNMLG